jgi:hypothetical protein
MSRTNVPRTSRSREPFTFRLRSVVADYRAYIEVVSRGMLQAMKDIARENLYDRLKVASGETVDKIDSVAEISGSQVKFKYKMPPTFHKMDKGRKPGEVSYKSSTDINAIRKWLKDKRRLFKADYSQWSMGKDRLGRKGMVERTSLRKGMTYLKRKGDYGNVKMSDQEIAAMITKKIQVYGTRSSRYKFMGVYKARTMFGLEYNKPKYLTYPKFISTVIMEEAYQYLKDALKEGSQYSDYAPASMKYFDPKTKTTKKYDFVSLNKGEFDKLEAVIEEIQNQLRETFLYLRHEAQGRVKYKQRKWVKDSLEDFGGYNKYYPETLGKPLAPKTPSGYPESYGKTKTRAAKAMIRKQAIDPNRFKTVYDVLKDAGLLDSLPAEISPKVKEILIAMLRQMTLRELQNLHGEASGASVRTIQQGETQKTEDQFVKLYNSLGGANMSDAKTKKLLRFKAETKNIDLRKDIYQWKIYLDKALKYLRKVK